ncbi:MAG: GIY-YIG nuclease family protein [Candidatus Pacebacteria bacterium]|jgi:putative endonuclease|nr:GIY-YIG nuclease family protein [Candidatus Paceibacterota bacterium]MBP9780409.1 GIY-YIG nuclease family protein [Candidatus Paceibacterota bacterium]MDQ5962059.1 putative endonuclease [Patescibacteria group bacterium]
MYYVYVLKSTVDEKLYIGFTGDLRRRFQEHNSGKSTSTSYRRPLVLVYYEAYTSRADAFERERKLKHFQNSYKQLKKRIGRSIEL